MALKASRLATVDRIKLPTRPVLPKIVAVDVMAAKWVLEWRYVAQDNIGDGF